MIAVSPRLLGIALIALGWGLATVASAAPFTSYVIRNNGMTPPVIQPNNSYPANPSATEFIIGLSSQKAGWGSNDINGSTIGQIQSLTITRYDNTGRFAAGSGPAVAPYFNIWVTDGLGHYAVLANEPSNPDFQSLFVTNMDGSKTYDLSFADLANKSVQVYETVNGGYNATNTWVNNLFGTNLTFGDVASLMIAPPPPGYIAGGNGVGSGAPRELGTNVAYGVNWIFGDTLSNYVSGNEGYVVGNPGVSAVGATEVPEPASLALWSLMGAAGLAAWRKRNRTLRHCAS
jgi:hypothetical protein